MKKTLAATLITVLLLSLSACNNNEAPTDVNLETTPTDVHLETAPASETSSATTAAITTACLEKAPPSAQTDPSKYIDENGLITNSGMAQIDRILNEQSESAKSYYCRLGLFDYDRDGIPEINIVKHTGSQGEMPVDIFSIDGALLGSFDGYCRDGFCRLSYGEDCVYVHNKYEHSVYQKVDDVQKLTFKEGKILTKVLFEENGYAADTFPIMSFKYKINGEAVEEAAYFSEYSSYLYEGTDARSREANEFSICDFDMNISDKITETVCGVYNSYISGKNAAKALFGSEPELFSFDDFDHDGSYEAFVLNSCSANDWYFWNGKELVKSAVSALTGCLDFTRYGDFFVAQPFSNGTSCYIFGVRGGCPYAHEASENGMFIRPLPDSGFNRMDLETGVFVLRKSQYDASSPGGSHTWKPYFFDENLNEIAGVPVTRADFADRPDVQSVFDSIEAEIKPEGGKIENAFFRGGTYLNINYTTPIFAEDEDGNETAAAERNYYKTFAVAYGRPDVFLIDEGRGVYRASIKD